MLMEDDQIRKCLSTLDLPKFIGPGGMHPQLLRALADVNLRPLSKIFEESC